MGFIEDLKRKVEYIDNELFKQYGNGHNYEKWYCHKSNLENSEKENTLQVEILADRQELQTNVENITRVSFRFNGLEIDLLDSVYKQIGTVYHCRCIDNPDFVPNHTGSNYLIFFH